jgi:hypothetical protein
VFLLKRSRTRGRPGNLLLPNHQAAVDQAAGEIVWHYLAEMRGLTEVPLQIY